MSELDFDVMISALKKAGLVVQEFKEETVHGYPLIAVFYKKGLICYIHYVGGYFFVPIYDEVLPLLDKANVSESTKKHLESKGVGIDSVVFIKTPPHHNEFGKYSLAVQALGNRLYKISVTNLLEVIEFYKRALDFNAAAWCFANPRIARIEK